MTFHNPLNTPEMKQELAQLNGNIRNSPFNVEKLMQWIYGDGQYKSPTAMLYDEAKRRMRQGQGGVPQVKDDTF